MSRESDNIFKETPDLQYTEEALETNFNEFEKVLRSRRSCRVYEKNIQIPKEVMRKSLELALLAPNSSNLQPWEFYWVRNPEKKKRLIEACLSQPAAKTASEIVVAIARTDTWKKHRRQMLDVLKQQEGKVRIPRSAKIYYEKIVPYAYSQGPFGVIGLIKKALISIVGLKKVVPREPTSQSEMKLWASKTTALACENFMLSMRASGFDTCPMEGLDQSRVKKILNLNSKAHVVMAISCGKRADNGIYGPQIRFPSEQFIKEV